jgi:hypothetical protein
MPEESEIVEPLAEEAPASENVHSGVEDKDVEDVADLTRVGESDKKKKKRSKRSKGKKVALVGDGESAASAETAPTNKMSSAMVQQILKNNPSLATETQGMDSKNIQEMLGRLNLEQLLTGMVCSYS